MYFIPKHNRLFSYCYALSGPMRMLVTCGILGTVLLAWFLCIYQPLLTMHTAQVIQEQQLGQQQPLVATCQEDVQILEKNLQQQQEQLSGALAKSDDIVGFLFSKIEAQQLSLELFTPYAQAANKEWYGVESFTIKIKGSYESIILFFGDIKKSGKMIRIVDTVLKKMEQDLFSATCVVELISLQEKTLQLHDKAEGLGG